VTLKFAEIYWNDPGQVVFSVEVEGEEVISDLDLIAEVGSYEAYDVAVFMNVADGLLNISFNAYADFAKVSAILIEAVTVGDSG